MGQQTVLTIPYVVTVDQGATSTADLVITVTGTNDSPVASSAAVSVAEDAALLTGSVSATDADANATLSFSLIDPAPAGLVFNTDGSYSFDASDAAYQCLSEGEELVLTVPYTVTDDHGVSSSADLMITVIGTNDEAVLSSDMVELVETDSELDLTASGQLSISDIDSPESFVAQKATPGLYGSFSIDETGAWSYVSDSAHDEFGEGDVETDSFEVMSADGTVTNVTLVIRGSNDAPVAEATAVSVYEEDVLFSESVFASDADATATLNFSLVDPAPAGLVFNTDGSYIFDASDAAYQSLSEGEELALTIPYLVTDDQGATSTADLVITVTGVNDDPVAQDMAETVSEHQDAVILVAAYDPVDGADTHTLSFDTADILGTVTDNGDSSFSYDAGGAFDGLSLGETAEEVFSYTVTDQWGASSTATVTVTIEGVNDGVEPVDGSAVRESVDRGSFDFTDPDANDTLHQVTAQAALYGATAALVVADTYGLGTQGQVVWSYTLDDGAVDTLADGQVVADGFDVTVDDFAGGSITQAISVAIATGTAGGDYLDGNAAADPGYEGSFQFGRGGDDTLKANYNDWLDGGDGIDLIDLSGATAPVSL